MLTPIHRTYFIGATRGQRCHIQLPNLNIAFRKLRGSPPSFSLNPTFTFSNPMPPKTNPYATPVHRRIDIILFAVVFAIVAILLSSSAHALPLYWDTSNQPGLQAGNGDWGTSNAAANRRWSNVIAGSTPAPWTQNSDAVFQTNGTSAVNVSGVGTNAITVNSITFNGTGYTISGDPLTLTGISGLITTNASAVINAPLQGTVGLTKLGTATLT